MTLRIVATSAPDEWTAMLPLQLQLTCWIHRPGHMPVLGKIVGRSKPIENDWRYDVLSISGEIICNVERTCLREDTTARSVT